MLTLVKLNNSDLPSREYTQKQIAQYCKEPCIWIHQKTWLMQLCLPWKYTEQNKHTAFLWSKYSVGNKHYDFFLPDDGRNTFYVGTFGSEGRSNGRFCFRQWDSCVRSLECSAIISSISTHTNTISAIIIHLCWAIFSLNVTVRLYFFWLQYAHSSRFFFHFYDFW